MSGVSKDTDWIFKDELTDMASNVEACRDIIVVIRENGSHDIACFGQ